MTLLFAACSSGLSDNGPLGNSGPNSGTICYPAAPGGVVQDAFEEFNDTGGTATIEKVALVRPRHLRLIAAWIGEGDTGIGKIGRGYPHPTKAWKRIPGAVVRHNYGQEVINLEIVVKPTARLGTASAINMYYEAGGTRYLRRFTDGLRVPVDGKC